jgi:hypothetical protein
MNEFKVLKKLYFLVFRDLRKADPSKRIARRTNKIHKERRERDSTLRQTDFS